VPNFHVTKQIQDPENFFKELILKKIPQPFIDDFIGDIIYLSWLSILTLLIIFISYKIIPIIIKMDFVMTPPPIPPKENLAIN